MIKTQLIHPEILFCLAANGHGGKILIADGNFPLSTATPGVCKKVFLNLAPGHLNVTQVLSVIKEAIAVESAIIMIPADDQVPEIHAEFKTLLGGIEYKTCKRAAFYQETKSEDVFLAIATGDTRRFANIILTMGVISKNPVK